MALDVIYCLGVCGQSADLSRFMIQCDICKDWFHGRCVGVREYQAVDIDRFHCPRCEPYHGPSVLKARLNWHRHDYSEADAANKAVQTGTQVFIKELRGRHFHDCDKVITRLQGSEFNLSWIAGDTCKSSISGDDVKSSPSGGGFTQPVLVTDKTGLEMVLPHPSFNVVDVENYVGSDHEVDVIDVQRQTDVKMRLHEFIEYFQSPARTTVLNLISLEFSGTGMSHLVEPPAIVRKLCWVNSAWPSDPPPPPPLNRPNVSKYCLIGVENSYTDFHIDFGGTSVWYHVLWGEKVFYLIKPTPGNLLLYERWMKASNHSELFFGDQVDACYKCVVTAGQTLFIPTGWIHAVLTPTDTLVFGGNFLHSYSIDLQLQIYDLEQSMDTPSKYKFPHYEEVCWFAGRSVLQQLKSTTSPPVCLLQGARALYSTLRQWLHQGVRGPAARVPEGVSASKLLKELQKELRSTEKQAVALNPPRPERESKRRKKKQLADDFVDYTNLTSFHCALEERLPKKEAEEYDSDDKHANDIKFKQEHQSPQLSQQHQNNIDPSEDKVFGNDLHHEQHTVSTSGESGAQGIPRAVVCCVANDLESLQHPQQLQAVQQQSDVTTPVQAGALKLSMPRPTSSYPYNLLTSTTDYGMSGTPPHDPECPPYPTDYPSNVKSEFNWSETPGVTPYRLARSTVGNSSVVGSSSIQTTPITSRLTPLRLRIGRNSVEAAAVAGSVVSTSSNTPIFYYESDPQRGTETITAVQHTATHQSNAMEQEETCDDDDEGTGLMIDESPVSRRLQGHDRAARGVIIHDPHKLKMPPLEMCSGMVYGGSTVEVGGEVEVSPQQAGGAGHHNGIEELLRASAYAPAEYNSSGGGGGVQHTAVHTTTSLAGGQYIQQYRTMDELDGSGRASPSTRDAIAGMLSMSRDVASANNSVEYGALPGVGTMAGRHRLPPGAANMAGGVYAQRRPMVATVMNKSTPRRYLEEESIKKVHQDDDYVYPTLDHSDDEDFPVFKPRGKKKEDEAWNPKARVRVWGPKPERPARQGARKQAVEKGLEVAASRRNSQPMAKRAYHRKKGRGGMMLPGSLSMGSGSGSSIAGTSSCIAGTSSSSSSLSSVSSSLNSSSHHHHHHHPTVHHHRPKKGMATAKQRLGKILKIHKMIY